MSAQHTPGPWTPEFGEAYRVRAQQDGGQVAIMMNLKGRHGLGGRRTGKEVAANARLIAAAPELLQALRLAEAALADIGDADREPGDDLAWCEARAAQALPAIRAAIAKAEGQWPPPAPTESLTN